MSHPTRPTSGNRGGAAFTNLRRCCLETEVKIHFTNSGMEGGVARVPISGCWRIQRLGELVAPIVRWPQLMTTMRNRFFTLALTALPYACFAADATGTWKSEFDSQIGRQKYTYTLKQEGDKLTGKANSEVNDQKREAPLSEGKVEGDKVSFVEM